MRLYIIIFLLIGIICPTIAQDGITHPLTFLQGHVYGGLPIELSVNEQDGILSGYSKYGSDGMIEFKIEGEITEDGYLLYEMDDQKVVSGILEINNNSTQCVWNSIDYKINLPVSLSNKGKKESTTYDYVTFESYIAVSYPRVDKKFESLMTETIGEVIKDIAGEYATAERDDNFPVASQRFNRRAIGINKITLDTEDLISGILTFYNNQISDVTTVTYTYDKDKKEMLDLNKIFKKNFNYSFFLKQYINQKKEKMKGLMSPLESTWLKASAFNHYVLTSSGLKFFNDYNTIFGRKSFTIPYYEISSSIQQKSIAQYIKKRK